MWLGRVLSILLLVAASPCGAAEITDDSAPPAADDTRPAIPDPASKDSDDARSNPEGGAGKPGPGVMVPPGPGPSDRGPDGRAAGGTGFDPGTTQPGDRMNEPGAHEPGAFNPSPLTPPAAPFPENPARPVTPATPDSGGAGVFVACVETPECVDRYLWSLYERTPKSFAWKDASAADKIGASVKDYVIGGMDPAFRTVLYRALRILDAAGFKPGITCGFRDDYRQSIVTGGMMKAANDRSFHGGSLRGGYGHGMAADIVSMKGDSQRMYRWIDRHEKELGIGRPYLGRDPTHVGPLAGEEYVAIRLAAARAQAERRRQTGRQRPDQPPRHGGAPRGQTGSLQTGPK